MINVEVSNIEEVLNNIDRMFDGYSRKLDKATAEVSTLAIDNIKNNILTGRSYKGGTIMGNAPATVNAKGFDFPLVHYALMVKGITKRSIQDGYEVYLGDKAEIGARLNRGYMMTFRNGATKKVPARPFFGVGKDLKDKIKQLLNLIFNGR